MFAHLHCHSYYSFLRGTVSPEEIAVRAAEMGMAAAALTDRNGIYGAVEFYQACLRAGVKPILGVELTEADRSERAGGRRGRTEPARGRKAVFLARNRRGWERICRLTTDRQLQEDFSLSRYGHHLTTAGPFYVRGTVQVKDDVPTIIGRFLTGI